MDGVEEVVCLGCGTSNPPGFRFCGGCGRSLEPTCPSCGAAVVGDLRFCGRCGAEVAPDRRDAAAHPHASGERKVVSVVFADLVASTELATRLDPEDLRAVYRPYFEAMAEEITRHGGTVEKFIGDAVVGVFGGSLVRAPPLVGHVAHVASGSATFGRRYGLSFRSLVCSGASA